MSRGAARVTFGTALRRGLRRRCPHCGDAPLFTGWMTMREPCPACGLRRLRQAGDAWAFYLLLDRAIFVAPVVLLVYLGLSPDRPWSLWGSVAALTAVLIATTPHRYGAAVALEYAVRRATDDLEDPEPGKPLPARAPEATVAQASGRSDAGSSRHGSGT